MGTVVTKLSQYFLRDERLKLKSGEGLWRNMRAVLEPLTVPGNPINYGVIIYFVFNKSLPECQ